MGLTVNLQQACVRVLLHCREFKDKQTLEPLFGIDPLPRYTDALPLEARSQVHLIEVVIHNLVSYPATKGEPLLDLLGVLRDKREEAGGEWKELDELCKQVSFYLSSLAGEPEPSVGGDRQKESETKEFRAAIRSYELGDRGREGTEDLETEAANWIAEVHERSQEWAFRVALSVFNGAPWDSCMEAALDLAKRLSPPVASTGDTSPPLDSPPRLQAPLKLLANAGGELVNAGTFRAVTLKEPQLARAVLDYVWDEYTRRDLLIEWLSDLVVSRNLNKRIRASIASGLLMLNNFESIQRSVFPNWVHADDDRNYRLAIGRALGVVAEEGSRLVEVRTLLKFWSSSRDQAFRWAAARAYIYVGLRCPIDEVITQWKIIADAEDIGSATINFGSFQWVLVNPLHVSLLDAMERFFLGAAEIPELRQTAFREGVVGFKRWADDERRNDQELGETENEDERQTFGLGLLMFIKLARIMLPGDAEYSSWPPVLLTLIEPDEDWSPYRKGLVEMLEQMLLDPAAQPTALDLLRNWLDRIEKNPHLEVQMRGLLDDLLSRVGLQGELRRLVAMHLGLWSPRSRFQISEEHPALGHLSCIVLVVDNSESALPFWTEIKSLALELGSALSDRVPPQVYFLNSGEVQTLAELADSKPRLDQHEKAACSLIAPVLRDLVERRQQVDALILIGNGEVFDLSDWVGHPLIDRWILVRLGPDSLACDKEQNVEQLTTNSPTAVYDRLLLPASKQINYWCGVKPGGVAKEQWQIDRSGYPLIRVDPLQSYVHLFPVAKVQFERFLASETPSSWGDEEYAELLRLNPRISYRASDQTKYERLLTAIKPAEAKDFGAWLGDNYILPDERQWLTCYDWLAEQPLTEAPPGIADDAFAIWQIVTELRLPSNLLELSLMCEGVKEWIRIAGKIEKHAGLGCPARRFHTLSRNPRKLVTVTTTDTRLDAYGFRLLKR